MGWAWLAKSCRGEEKPRAKQRHGKDQDNAVNWMLLFCSGRCRAEREKSWGRVTMGLALGKLGKGREVSNRHPREDEEQNSRDADSEVATYTEAYTRRILIKIDSSVSGGRRSLLSTVSRPSFSGHLSLNRRHPVPSLTVKGKAW